MNQEDIFRLLLIVLLLANRQLADNNGNRSDSDSTDDDNSFSYTLINDFLILTMITKLFCNPSPNTTTTDTTF